MSDLSQAKGSFIRNRDIFVHDGQHLRRVRLSVGMQALIAAAFIAILAWSGFTTTRMLAAPSGMSADLTSLAAATELRARQIEQRQELLAAMLAGKDVGALPATTRISALPGC